MTEGSLPLSFTSAISTPQCAASLRACQLASFLEEALLSEALAMMDSPHERGGAGARGPVCVPHACVPHA